MSNSTLSAIRGRVRTRLNEPTPGFWTNANLNEHIQSSYVSEFGLYLRKNPKLAAQTVDLSYTALAESMTLTTTGYTVGRITLVEDRTTIQPGVVLDEAETKAGVVTEAADPEALTNPTGTPSRWYFERQSSATTGVLTITQKLFLSPVPGSTRSLRIHYAAEAQALSGDTYTTGLPDDYEEALICGACVLAKIQEQVPPGILQGFRDQLKEAETRIRENAGGPARGPGRIVYHDDTH
jgi:hypothetical protein